MTTAATPARWRIWTALAVGVLGIAAVAVIAPIVAARSIGPVTLTGIDQPGAGTPACTSLMSSLPQELGGIDRRETLGDATAAAAWGDPAAVLRCGIPDPVDLTCSSALTVVNGVSWLELQQDGRTSYIAVDRPVRVALTLDPVHGSGPITVLSDLISTAMPARDVCRDGVLVPVEAG